MWKRSREYWIIFSLAGLSLLVIAGVLVGLWWFNLGPLVGRAYTMEELGIQRELAETDYDGDGIDDYTEFLNGARKDVKNHPRYDGSYVEGGFPPETQGVCTDVIWRAFREAGYDLREMVDQDIAERPEAYPWITERDKNIDFRRVANLEEFFREHGMKLSNDWRDLEEWQPGDIIIAANGTHIGMVSDKRTKEGRPYIIHNEGQPQREEDYLKRGKVTGHYRWLLDD